MPPTPDPNANRQSPPSLVIPLAIMSVVVLGFLVFFVAIGSGGGGDEAEADHGNAEDHGAASESVEPAENHGATDEDAGVEAEGAHGEPDPAAEDAGAGGADGEAAPETEEN